MPSLTSAQLLSLWEAGETWPDVQRAHALLAAGRPDLSSTAITGFSLGERNSQLINLREMLFGSQLNALVECQNCGESLEFELSSPTGATIGEPPEDAPIHSIEIGQWRIQFRLPNSSDLASLNKNLSIEQGRLQLLEGCLIETIGLDGPVPPSKLPAEVLERVESHMAELDPYADIAMDLTCPACNTSTTTWFDVIHYFWLEIDQWARHTLHEIHIVATAYGWNEAEILALSPRRRRHYLGLIYG